MSKKARLKIIDAMTEENSARLRQVLLKARDRAELTIIRYAKKENFVAAAYVRDNLYKEIGELYKDLQGKVDVWGRRAVTKTAREWRRLAIDDLPAGSYNQTWSQFDRKFLRDMVAEFSPSNPERLAAVNAALGGMLKNDITALRAAHRDVMRLGSATGMTQEQMTRELIARLAEVRPGWQFVDRAGRTWNTRSYFNMLSKTVSANAARATYADVLTESGHDLVTVEGGFTRSICDFCVPWVGRMLSLTGATPGFPTEADARESGLFHPNCRHYLAVVLKGEVTESRKRESEYKRRRAEYRAEKKAAA